MNYYEHHIGDYDKNTSHLTACEDGIYSRLIRRYYDKEAPLPPDVDDVKRLARARNKQERKAVDAILREFFTLQPDGWHHKVCDEVIALYQAGEPEREAKKKNEATRLHRHREERARLFEVLNAAGQHLPWNTKMEQLRTAVERIHNGNGNAKPATPATTPATPATATQSPIPSHQTPDTNLNVLSGGVSPPPGPPPAPTAPPAPSPTPKPSKAAKPAKEPPPTNATWEAYSTAYERAYGVKPVRNATVNGLLAQVVARLGAEEAPLVAAFYLKLASYREHPLALLVRDCEGIRTRWATGNRAVQAAAPTAREERMRSALGRHAPTLAANQARRPADFIEEEASHALTIRHG